MRLFRASTTVPGVSEARFVTLDSMKPFSCCVWLLVRGLVERLNEVTSCASAICAWLMKMARNAVRQVRIVIRSFIIVFFESSSCGCLLAGVPTIGLVSPAGGLQSDILACLGALKLLSRAYDCQRLRVDLNHLPGSPRRRSTTPPASLDG